MKFLELGGILIDIPMISSNMIRNAKHTLESNLIVLVKSEIF